MNGYDPTEATISCTMKAIESADNITIGIPNANVQVVMLDEKNKSLPIGALGELTILGDGVGRGYIDRGDKVAMAAYLKNLPIVYADVFKYPTAEKLESYILSQDTSTSALVEKKFPSPKKFLSNRSWTKYFNLNAPFQKIAWSTSTEFVIKIWATSS